MLNYVLTHYWGVIVVIIAALVYGVTHRQVSIQYAKCVAGKLMLAAEKRAEELLLTTGADKLSWVVDNGYMLLPSVVKAFISKTLFQTIVQALYDEAVAFAKAHAVKDVSNVQNGSDVSNTTDAK